MSEALPTLVWVDLEMTGLDPRTCEIVEIATLVTDQDLNVLAEGPSLVVRPSDAALANMSEFVTNLHKTSGLYDRILASTLALADATRQTVAFVERHVVKGTSPLCGNSVWKDREFIAAYMPELLGLLHYRMIDVSGIKELVRRWYPAPYQAPKKREVHRALDDIRESLAELRWYRQKVFVAPEAPEAPG
jgi:oligoribonuclease